MFSDFRPRAGEVGVEERRVGVGVEQARDADAEVLAALHQRNALFDGLGDEEALGAGDGVGDHFDIARPEDVVRGDIDEVGIGFLDLVDVGLDVLHVGEVFDGSLFAGGDDEALLAHAQRHLGLARLEFDGLRQFDDFAGAGRDLNLDERLGLGLEGRGRVRAASATGTAPTGAARRAMGRFDGRQVGLDGFEAGELRSGYGDFFRCRGAIGRDGRCLLCAAHVHIDEGAQAVVLAEVAARVFVACCAIADVGDGFECR